MIFHNNNNIICQSSGLVFQCLFPAVKSFSRWPGSYPPDICTLTLSRQFYLPETFTPRMFPDLDINHPDINQPENLPLGHLPPRHLPPGEFIFILRLKNQTKVYFDVKVLNHESDICFLYLMLSRFYTVFKILKKYLSMSSYFRWNLSGTPSTNIVNLRRCSKFLKNTCEGVPFKMKAQSFI